jgi:hypothetical protein
MTNGRNDINRGKNRAEGTLSAEALWETVRSNDFPEAQLAKELVALWPSFQFTDHGRAHRSLLAPAAIN